MWLEKALAIVTVASDTLQNKHCPSHQNNCCVKCAYELEGSLASFSDMKPIHLRGRQLPGRVRMFFNSLETGRYGMEALLDHFLVCRVGIF